MTPKEADATATNMSFRKEEGDQQNRDDLNARAIAQNMPAAASPENTLQIH